MKALVTGATGQLGLAVAEALVARGDSVSALVRDPSRAAPLRERGLRLVPGDVTDPASLRAAVEGQDAVFHLAGLVSYAAHRAPDLWAVNHRGTVDLLDAAALVGVPRFVYTSSIATLGHVPPGQIGDESSVWNWSELGITYFESKRAAELAVLQERRLSCVVVNPGIVIGPGDVQLNGARMLVQLHRRALPGVPPGATTLAGLREVVEAHLVAHDRGAPGQRHVLGGTVGDFATLYARIAAAIGAEAPKRVLPAWALRAMGSASDRWAALRGTEPQLSRALAEITTRNRQYRSDLAERALDYRPRPLELSVSEAWRWLRDSGRC